LRYSLVISLFAEFQEYNLEGPNFALEY